MIKIVFSALVILTTLHFESKSSQIENNMSQDSDSELIKILIDSKLPLQDRIDAAIGIGKSKDSSLVSDLKKCFNRSRPQPISIKNWDPVAAERVIDLYIVEALHKLGDDSERNRITLIVSIAGRILRGPDDELKNACIVIQSIGLKESIHQLIDLTNSNSLNEVRNAVSVLVCLNLPNAPIGGSTDSVLPTDKFVFEFDRLRQEMEMLVNKSNGKIQLSDSVNEYLRTNDFDRGHVKLEERTLRDRVEQDLSMLDFDYFVEKDRVVICTHQEAGKRWRDWWIEYHDSLPYK